MLGGGCAGSTAGGIKLIRYLVAMKAIRRELLRYIEPARIVPIRLDGHKVNDQMVLQVIAFLFIYILCWAIGTFVFVLLGQDFVTAGSVAISCLSNIGPALGDAGPDQNYAGLGEVGQTIAMGLMLLGRLEFLASLWHYVHSIGADNGTPRCISLPSRNWQPKRV